MKVTLEISDALLRQARELAARKGVTLNALIERGLSRVIVEADKPISFKLRRAAFRGKRLQEEFRDASWAMISEAAYGCYRN